MQHCANRPFNHFIEIAIILKNLINELHERILESSISRIMNNADQVHVLFEDPALFLRAQQEAPLIPRIPDAREVTAHSILWLLWDLKNYVIPLMYNFATFRKNRFVDGNRISLVSGLVASIFGHLIMAADFRDFGFMHPPHIFLNCLAFPPSHRPKATDSPGVAAYKEVLRYVHVIFYVKKNTDPALFEGNLLPWLNSRDKQWHNYYIKIPHLIIATTLTLPVNLALLAAQYRRTRNDIILYQRTRDLNAPPINLNSLNSDGLLWVSDFCNFVIASCVASIVIRKYDLLEDDNTDPVYNEALRRYLHIYASTIVGFAVFVAYTQISPRAVTVVQQAPTAIRNTITVASNALAECRATVANTITSTAAQASRMIGYVWPRARVVVAEQQDAGQEHTTNAQPSHRRRGHTSRL